MTNKKQTTNDFIKKALLINNNLVNCDYSVSNYTGWDCLLHIRCTVCNQIFIQQAQVHLKGGKCPVCLKFKQSSNTNDFIEKAKLINDNETHYNYCLVEYIKSCIKVKIICNVDEHGIFEQTPNHHLDGMGCPKCSLNKRSKLLAMSTKEFIEKAKLINPYSCNYDYSLVEYINSKTLVKIICSVNNHGIFNQKPSKHLAKQGCPKCNSTTPYTNKTFIQKAQSIGNNIINFGYALIDYINYTTPVKIICNKGHGIFKQKPREHLDGNGCPKCMKRKDGNIYYVYIDYLSENNIPFYVGKGTETRLKVKGRNKKHKKISLLGFYRQVVFFTEFEDIAYSIENQYINICNTFYNGSNIFGCNKTKGNQQ